MTFSVPRLDARTTLTDRVYEVLREMILKGQLAPGERITESDIANRMGVSITPVREAFLKLEAAGLLIVRPRQAAQVTMLSLHDLRQLAMIRAALEQAILPLTVERATDADIAAIRETLNEMERLLNQRDWDSYAENHRRLHERMVEPAGCPMIARMVLEVFDAGQRYWRQVQTNSSELWDRDHRYHLQLFDAIVRKDIEAVRAMLAFDHHEYPDLVSKGVLHEKRPFASFFAEAAAEVEKSLVGEPR